MFIEYYKGVEETNNYLND